MPSPWRRWWYRLNHPGGVPARWFWAWVVLLVVLTNLNHLLGWLAQPEGSYYLGHGWVFNSLDYNTYVSKLQQGQLGLWHYFNWYTPENLLGSGFNLLYRATGWLTGPLGWSPLFAMTVLRLVVTVAVVHSLIRLVRLDEKVRHSWGWVFSLVVLALPMTGLLDSEVRGIGGLLLPEAGVLTSLAFVPHFGLGLLALSEWAQWWIGKEDQAVAWRKQDYGWAITWLGLLALVYPFALLQVLVIAVGLALLNLRQRERRVMRRSLWVMVGVVLSMIVGYGVLTHNSPVYGRLLFGHSYLSVGPMRLLLELGVLGVAVLGISLRRLWRKEVSSLAEQLMTVWWWASFIMFYLPLTAAPRLTLGWQIPTVLLVVLYLQSYVSGSLDRWLRGLIAVSVLSSCWLFGLNLQQVREREAYHVAADTREVLGTLQNFDPGTQVVLAEPVLSNYLPVLTHQRVVYGNPWETIEGSERKREVENFFDQTQPRDSTLLERYQVDWVITDRGGESFLSDLILEDEVGQMRLYRVD